MPNGLPSGDCITTALPPAGLDLPRAFEKYSAAGVATIPCSFTPGVGRAMRNPSEVCTTEAGPLAAETAGGYSPRGERALVSLPAGCGGCRSDSFSSATVSKKPSRAVLLSEPVGVLRPLKYSPPGERGLVAMGEKNGSTTGWYTAVWRAVKNRRGPTGLGTTMTSGCKKVPAARPACGAPRREATMSRT